MLERSFSDQQPRYRSVADALMDDISSGKLARGDTLPSEFALVDEYKVSRYTVREALRVLENTGMISRRQGKGTVVTGRMPVRAYVLKHRTFPRVLQYPADTHLCLESTQRVSADAEFAEMLHCRAGSEWIVLSGVRRHYHHDRPFCWTDICLDPEFGWLAPMFGHEDEPEVWPLIRKLDHVMEDLHVNLAACGLSDEIAQKLDREPGTAALCITRSVLNAAGHAFVIDVSRHPGDCFSYSVDFHREWVRN